ncbi:hypothetical protein GDO81_002672 [Engystomops pustulosus]|uniref:Uncharacterized protein n=1 Tax=Engystomops pustulosus TaxID=76066 RepID=A0AAV7DM38_ENGPU|nr:hypothetical protein GDO81_002672 [Engystomops pustulosus]
MCPNVCISGWSFIAELCISDLNPGDLTLLVIGVICMIAGCIFDFYRFWRNR